jgi:2-oxo-4-hydroxy-4-carboxy-5-ureidoimidazoline decarboxylase
MQIKTHKHTIAELNHAPLQDFVAIVGPVFEHSPWIAEATATRRPFSDLQNLHQALCETVRTSAPERQLALIRAHPDLVGKAALAGTLTPQSTSEQASAGLNKLSAEEIATFQKLNEAYRTRFGFPFVICARENKKEAILKGLQVRIPNSREDEIKTALEEIAKIAYLRLQDIVHV